MQNKTSKSVVISRQVRNLREGNGWPHLWWEEIQMENWFWVKLGVRFLCYMKAPRSLGCLTFPKEVGSTTINMKKGWVWGLRGG